MEELKSVEEIIERLLELAKDMDFADYEENEEQTKKDIKNALYNLKAYAQNEYNSDYWRTFYNLLQLI